MVNDVDKTILATSLRVLTSAASLRKMTMALVMMIIMMMMVMVVVVVVVIVSLKDEKMLVYKEILGGADGEA